MFDQILTFAVSQVQLITAALILVAVVLEIIHIGQTRRMNKRLGRAGHWLQRYLNVVFREDTDDKLETEETDIGPEIKIQKMREKVKKEKHI